MQNEVYPGATHTCFDHTLGVYHPLVAIEEPELGLHADILPQLAGPLIEVGERTQVIVTTHSDILVERALPNRRRPSSYASTSAVRRSWSG